MLQRTLPAGFIAPCLPSKTDKLSQLHGRFSESCMMIIHPVASPKRGQNDRSKRDQAEQAPQSALMLAI
jgi:hypothetical protein